MAPDPGVTERGCEDRGELPFLRPALPATDRIDAYFEASRTAGWFSNGGPCSRLLADRISERLPDGADCALLANGTLALALATRAAFGRAGEKREVLLPSFTFAAVPSAVVWAGFKPVFVDVDRDSWQMCPGSLEQTLADRADDAAGVLACSTFGTMPPPPVRESWARAAEEAGVPMIVDSAAGFGSQDQNGTRMGAMGSAEIFSFHATKTFAIGEGGAVASVNREMIAKVRQLANFGFNEARIVDGEAGLNAKMDEWSAATGLALLEDFDAILESRRGQARKVVEATASLGFRTQPGSASSAWQFVPLMAPSSDVRSEVLKLASKAAIGVRTYFDPPLHRMPGFSAFNRAGTLSDTEFMASRILSLPMSNDMTDGEVTRVIQLLEESVT